MRDDRTKGEVYKEVTGGTYDNKRNAANSKMRKDAADRKLKQFKICRICRRTPAETQIDLHHIKPIEDFSDDTWVAVINAPENTVFLCEECHKRLHRGEIELPPPVKVEIYI